MNNYRTTRLAWRIVPGVLLLAMPGMFGCSSGLGELFSAAVTVSGRLEPNQDIVLIRFRNLSAWEAVDVGFYATNDELVTLPDDLLVDAFLVSANLGVAGTGIIQPLQDDIIEFPCTPQLTIGTDGGTFLDNDSGELRGVGTARWAQQGPLSLCGTGVTFVFSKEGDEFRTVLLIGG